MPGSMTPIERILDVSKQAELTIQPDSPMIALTRTGGCQPALLTTGSRLLRVGCRQPNSQSIVRTSTAFRLPAQYLPGECRL